MTAAAWSLAWTQTPPTTTLTVDLENVVEYRQGILDDPAKFATSATVTPTPQSPGNFGVTNIIGDIAAVNGQPAKGLFVGRTRSVVSTPTPGPGQAIADVVRTALREQIFEILQPDGTPIGSVLAMGFSGGPAPPGQPSAERGNWAIVGGTGAFLGARGQVEGAGNVNARAASMAEDPANRRINGGGPSRYFLHVIPMTVPQIVTTPNGPAVTHSGDFALVSPSKPALAGEILSLFAVGLGPARGVVLGQPFPATPLAPVNSPVAVTVNGNPADVLGAVGYPNAVDNYQVNFRMPADTLKGTATIQLNVAWIGAAPVNIVVQ